MSTPMTCFTIGRAALGATQLSAPNLIAAKLFQQSLSANTQAVVRLLGARHLAQAAITATIPSRRVLMAGAAVDALHAATMIAAAIDQRCRRVALADAATAAGLAIAGLSLPIQLQIQ